MRKHLNTKSLLLFSSDFRLQRERALLVFPKDLRSRELREKKRTPDMSYRKHKETYECNAMKWFCLRACSGTSRSTVSGGIPESSVGHKLIKITHTTFLPYKEFQHEKNKKQITEPYLAV